MVVFQIEKNQIVAVSKGRSIEQIIPLYQQGYRNFGENRIEELVRKKEMLPDDIAWHFIGAVQRKKVPKLIGLCTLIHSIDSLPLATKFSFCSERKGVVTNVLLQINISGEESKQGFSIHELQRDYENLKQLVGIKIKGFMTIAPLTDDWKVVRRIFSTLRQIRDEIAGELSLELSMGMSRDYQIAIEEGATMIRIGTALFEEKN